MLLPLLSLLFAQFAAAPTLDQDRLTVCQAEARRDPTGAIATASAWLAELSGGDHSYPQQCLGVAYVSLLRWQAAEQAFMAAHDTHNAADPAGRARLAAMAGNAALADNRYQPAREHFPCKARPNRALDVCCPDLLSGSLSRAPMGSIPHPSQDRGDQGQIVREGETQSHGAR